MTRLRALFGVLPTFTAGAAIGGAVGCSLAQHEGSHADGSVAAGLAELPSSGDSELDELRWLAVVAPIEELVEQRLLFANCVARTYRRDPVLWRGMERLSRLVLEQKSFPDRRVTARYLAQVIEVADEGVAKDLTSLIPVLRGVR